MLWKDDFLDQCGENNTVSDVEGNKWNYIFYCPPGFSCTTEKKCKNSANTVVKSVVDRYDTNKADNLYSFKANVWTGAKSDLQHVNRISAWLPIVAMHSRETMD